MYATTENFSTGVQQRVRNLSCEQNLRCFSQNLIYSILTNEASVPFQLLTLSFVILQSSYKAIQINSFTLSLCGKEAMGLTLRF